MQLTRVPTSLARGCLALACGVVFAGADDAPTPAVERPIKDPRELIGTNAQPVIAAALADKVTPENSHVVLSLAKQRAYLMLGDRIYIDSPMSSGKRASTTPIGTFSILEKNQDHRTSTYGDFVDRQGRVIRSGVNMKADSAPSGTHYLGRPMKYFCRLTEAGLGLHAGILPGYPASDGCIRIPEQVAKIFFEKVRVGTPVEIRAE